MHYDTKMLSAEMRLAMRLRELGEKINPFAGDCYFEQRRERMRGVCRKLKDRRFDETLTIGQAFIRAYGCDL